MTGPCNVEGCDCGHTIETLRRQNAELRELVKELWEDVQYESDTATVQRFEPRVEALARQHKGGWRHLDRDAEKPEDQEWYLISDGESILRGHYSEEFNVFGSGALMVKTYRWWMPLPQPPKD